MMISRYLTRLGLPLLMAGTVAGENLQQDFSETQLGLRPRPGETVQVNPPDFAWGPKLGESHYRIELSKNEKFTGDILRLEETPYTIQRPGKILEVGQWYWRIHALDTDVFSRVYSFFVSADIIEFPAPDFDHMLERIPGSHPRLFLRPEELSALRSASSGNLADEWAYLQSKAEEALRRDLENPVPEPERHPGAQEIALWRQNYTTCRDTVYAGEILAFCYLISQESRYANGARKVLHHLLSWDPSGTTSMRVNDECGMPVLQYLPRLYDWLYPVLTESERAAVVQNLAIRGREARKRLGRLQHRAYDSHGHRMFHQLAEAGIAVYGEVPESSEWIRHALNIYHCWYPAWGDVDGGWSAGLSYYAGYVLMLTSWLDTAEAAMSLNPSLHPYVSVAGDFGMYLGPGGVFTHSFGDGAESISGSRMRPVLETLGMVLKRGDLAYAASKIDQDSKAGWFQVAPGATRPQLFIRKALRGNVFARPSSDLAPSKIFRGTGMAVLNTDVVDGRQNVQVQFRSSRLGTISHMHSDQNSFLISAFGERLAIQSGFRPWYGSPFCKSYYWASRSKNTILVNGEGQVDRSLEAVGEITRHHFGKTIDIVEGHAEDAYGGKLQGFSRVIVFVKPEWVIVIDKLETELPSIFTWQFHSENPIQVDSKGSFSLSSESASLEGRLLPESLRLETTRGWPVEPERPTSLKEQWHLSAMSPKLSKLTILAVLRVSRKGGESDWRQSLEGGDQLRIEDGDFLLHINDLMQDVKVEVARDGELVETARLPR